MYPFICIRRCSTHVFCKFIIDFYNVYVLYILSIIWEFVLLLRYTNIIIVVYEACEICCQYTIFSMVERYNKKHHADTSKGDLKKRYLSSIQNYFNGTF